MTRSFLPELQESFGDDESESYSASSSPPSSPWSSCSSIHDSSIPPVQGEHQPLHPQPPPSANVLVIGAASANGHEIIRQLYDHPSRPHIHAFIDESTSATEYGGDSCPAALPIDLQVKCKSIVEGSVRHAIDLEEAIANTCVDWVLLCGAPLDHSSSSSRNHHLHHPDTKSRTIAAKNLATALSRPGFEHVRVMIVSRVGTKQCPVRSTLSYRGGVMGVLSMSIVSSILSLYQRDREEIADCSGQEEALSQLLLSNKQDGAGNRRLTIIRSTSVVSSSSSSSSSSSRESPKWVELNRSSISSLHGSIRCTQRNDLASCVVDELCSGQRKCRTIHIASLT